MMTQQQRSDAARKAAASRRANRMNGYTASASAPTAGRYSPRRAFAPESDPRALAFEALAKLEEALVAKAKKTGITPEMNSAFERYQKIKARALQPGTISEGDVALRLGTVELIKLVF